MIQPVLEYSVTALGCPELASEAALGVSGSVLSSALNGSGAATSRIGQNKLPSTVPFFLQLAGEPIPGSHDMFYCHPINS